MDQEDNTTRDLFGAPITFLEKRRKKSRPHFKDAGGPAGAANDPGEPTIKLLLPMRYEVEGTIEKNPLRKIAKKAQEFEGTIEAVQLKRLSGFRFKLLSGETIFIVSKKTLVAVAGEPILLVPGADSVEAVEETLSRGAGVWLPRNRCGRLRSPTKMASTSQIASLRHGVVSSYSERASSHPP
ncbi:hypothetical protein [Mesorhizobium australicum]|uniref:hypothetical protein n=1 Tax=Mesorhizobium australicum TaxID=536018 RepID=UPI003336C49A